MRTESDGRIVAEPGKRVASSRGRSTGRVAEAGRGSAVGRGRGGGEASKASERSTGLGAGSGPRGEGKEGKLLVGELLHERKGGTRLVEERVSAVGVLVDGSLEVLLLGLLLLLLGLRLGTEQPSSSPSEQSSSCRLGRLAEKTRAVVLLLLRLLIRRPEQASSSRIPSSKESASRLRCRSGRRAKESSRRSRRSGLSAEQPSSASSEE
jgi:hypothetical protein